MSTINGVNVDQLVSTVEAIKANPSLANFTFRSTTDWLEGGYSRTTIQSFYGVGQEDTSRTEPFIVYGDEPHVLLGTNKGPNAGCFVGARVLSQRRFRIQRCRAGDQTRCAFL